MRADIKEAIEIAQSKRHETKLGRPAGSRNKIPRLSPKRTKAQGMWDARKIAELCGFNPIPIMIDVIMKGVMPSMPIPNPLGGPPTITEPQIVSVEDRRKTLSEITQYMYPKLSATQITGKDGGPVAIAALDVTMLMGDPELAAAAQILALAIAERGAQIPAPEDPEDLPMIDGETEPVLV